MNSTTTTSSCCRCGHGYERHVHPIPGGSCRECVELGQIVCQHFRPAETRATTTTMHPVSFDYAVPPEYYGDHGADFDTDAINSAICDAINAQLPATVTLARSGQVIHDVSLGHDAARFTVEYAADLVDVQAIVASHERHRPTTCPSWCTIDHEGPDDEGLHRADVERTDGFTVTVYRTDPADYQVHVDTNSFRGLTVEEALGLADALVRAARLVEGES